MHTLLPCYITSRYLVGRQPYILDSNVVLYDSLECWWVRLENGMCLFGSTDGEEVFGSCVYFCRRKHKVDKSMGIQDKFLKTRNIGWISYTSSGIYPLQVKIKKIVLKNIFNYRVKRILPTIVGTSPRSQFDFRNKHSTNITNL